MKIYGKEHREFYAIPGMWVCEDGKSIYRYYKDDIKSLLKSRPPKKMAIQKDTNGNAIIRTRDHGVKRVDNLVLRCYRGNPKCVSRAFHIDGNKSNCHINNLKWISIQEYNDLYHKNDDWKELFGENDEIQINVKTGEVKQFGETVPHQNYIYDRDTARMVEIDEFVELSVETKYGTEKKRFSVSALVQSVINQ